MLGEVDQVGKVSNEVCQDCQLCHAKNLHETVEIIETIGKPTN